MRHALLALALAALAAGGCGTAPATVKGRLVKDGQPMTVPATTVAVTLTQLDPPAGDDKGGPKQFTTPVNADGTFEVVVSGGQIPPGNYRVSIMGTGKLGAQFKAFGDTNSPIRRELKPGANDLTIDVGKPEG